MSLQTQVRWHSFLQSRAQGAYACTMKWNNLTKIYVLSFVPFAMIGNILYFSDAFLYKQKLVNKMWYSVEINWQIYGSIRLRKYFSENKLGIKYRVPLIYLLPVHWFCLILSADLKKYILSRHLFNAKTDYLSHRMVAFINLAISRKKSDLVLLE